jgi:hypothetical protein
MENESKRVRMELTEDQRRRLKEAAGTDPEAIELDLEELEERVAPWWIADSTLIYRGGW